MNASIMSRQDLWRQYEISIDLYKHYLKLTIELNVFYYAITGAIISYYTTHAAQASARYALALPLLMSVLLAILFICGVFLNRVSRKELFDIRDALGLKVAPELAVLSALLVISAILMLVVAITLSALLVGCLGVD